MSTVVEPLPPMSAADQELAEQTYIQVLSQDELMKKLDKELRSSAQPPTVMHFAPLAGNGEHPAGSEASKSWLDLPCAWYPRPPRTTPVPPNSIHEFLRVNGVVDIPLGPAHDYIDFADIYPLFRFENWAIGPSEDVMKAAWTAMAPAFALSTRWLTTPEFQGYWHRLAFGEPTTENGKTYLARSPIEDDLPLACSRFGEILKVLADKIKFWWVPQNMPDGTPMEGCFTTNRFGSVFVLDKILGEEILRRSGCSPRKSYDYDGRIGISCEFLYHLLSPESSTRFDECARMRMQFRLAAVLCHELCHAVYQWRRLPLPEVYVFPSDAMAETGLSWSQNVLGADESFGARGMGYLLSHTYKYLYSYPAVSHVINDRWIEAWFRKDTWARIDEVVRRNLLRLPDAAGLSGPTVWIAERFVMGRMLAVVYKDGEVVWPEDVVGRVDAPSEGMSPEEWFVDVRKRDIELAIAAGFKKDYFQEAEGPYANRKP
ncbi:hypothetical protein SLS60_008522 [Paraconiothyrium brasiliense]|uniref:Uncharacterized protein n=1 Tax=Paraconiothyrium brasiliense TaxID=300254 RepID=A0ABR3R1P8_9PLEO